MFIFLTPGNYHFSIEHSIPKRSLNAAYLHNQYQKMFAPFIIRVTFTLHMFLPFGFNKGLSVNFA